MDQRRIEYSVGRKIEKLMDAWADLQDKQRQLDNFDESHHPPELPPKFESVSDLMDYNQQKERYDKSLRGYEKRVNDSRHAFQVEERDLIPYFPEGVPLVHEYQTYGTPHAGNTYEIMKVGLEDGPSIQVRQIDD